jgi:hypothetical protein
VISLVDRFNQVSMHDIPPDILEIYKNVPEINEIDNRGFPICRPLFSHSSVPRDLGLKDVWLDDFDFKLPFVYAIYVHHNQRLWTKHIDLIPNDVLVGVKNGKGFLLFDNTVEGNRIDGEWFIDPFYKSISDIGISADKIIFITNNLMAEETHDEWFENQSVYDKKIKLVSFMWNVYDVQQLIRSKNLPNQVNIQHEIEYKSKNLEKIKYFLKVNRTNRPERNIFMLFMNYHKLFDKSLVSFPTLPDEYHPPVFEKYLTKENIEDLKSKVPFDIDNTDRANHGESGQGKGFFDADLPFQPIHYNNSFISVVMSAFPFIENACHLHSSTFNPIYCGHPIIQFGPYKALEVMKERGFKTFNKWWDESYDDEPNHWKRLEKVMGVVLEVSKLSQKELLDIYIDMKDVLQHNVDLITNFDVKSELHDRLFDDRPQT